MDRVGPGRGTRAGSIRRDACSFWRARVRFNCISAFWASRSCTAAAIHQQQQQQQAASRVQQHHADRPSKATACADVLRSRFHARCMHPSSSFSLSLSDLALSDPLACTLLHFQLALIAIGDCILALGCRDWQ